MHSLGDSRPQPWTSLHLDRRTEEFQFAVVSDNSGTPRPGVWREAMHKLNLLQPSFVMSVGDLIEGYVSTAEQINQQWDHFLSDLSPLQVPFFFVAGNHDVGRPLWYDVYRQRIGPTWYYFVYHGVLFLVVDTNDGPDHGTGMSDQQIAWIEKVLLEIPADKVRWTMVFQHKPLWNDNNAQWNRVKQMLAHRQKVTVLAGHIHEYLATQIDGIEYVALATTGGGSPLRGRDAGEIDHVTWITMKDDGPIVANIQLDSILPVDFRTNDLARKYNDLRTGKFLSVSPVDQGQTEFSQAKVTATIKNPDSNPLRLKVLFEPQSSITVQPAAIVEQIPANGQLKVELEISAQQPVKTTQTQPIAMHWQAAIDRPATTSLEWSGTNRLILDGINQIQPSQSKTIDGDLSDWTELPYVVQQPSEIHTNALAWRGRHDSHFRFGVAADDQYLFCAIEVMDDQISHDDEMIWQDFAGVFVNPLMMARPKAEEIKKHAFAVMAGLSMSAEDKQKYQFGNPPENVQAIAKQVEGGVIYEFAIPTGRFNELQNGKWSQLQINVLVNDHDDDDARQGLSVLYWRPRWDGMNHYPTSGIFHRQ